MKGILPDGRAYHFRIGDAIMGHQFTEIHIGPLDLQDITNAAEHRPAAVLDWLESLQCRFAPEAYEDTLHFKRGIHNP